jgi:hypothetical protein
METSNWKHMQNKRYVRTENICWLFVNTIHGEQVKSTRILINRTLQEISLQSQKQGWLDWCGVNRIAQRRNTYKIFAGEREGLRRVIQCLDITSRARVNTSVSYSRGHGFNLLSEIDYLDRFFVGLLRPSKLLQYIGLKQASDSTLWNPPDHSQTHHHSTYVTNRTGNPTILNF